MNGNSILIDTNIALYLLNGDRDLAELLYLKRIHLSFINELELLGYSGLTTSQQKKVVSFIRDCQITDINTDIKNEVVRIREDYKLKCRTVLSWLLHDPYKFLSLPLTWTLEKLMTKMLSY